jgi:hypothetical protein
MENLSCYWFKPVLILISFLIFQPNNVYSSQYSIVYDNSGSMPHWNSYYWIDIWDSSSGGDRMTSEDGYYDPPLPFKIASNGNNNDSIVNVRVSYDIGLRYSSYERNVEISSVSIGAIYSARIYDYSNGINVLYYSQYGEINPPFAQNIAMTLPLKTNTWYCPIFGSDYSDIKVDFKITDPSNPWYYEIFLAPIISNPRYDIVPVPEPATLLLLGAGFCALIGCGRRRIQK